MEKKMKLATRAVHAGDRQKPSAAIPVTTPIVSAASYIYDDNSINNYRRNRKTKRRSWLVRRS